MNAEPRHTLAEWGEEAAVAALLARLGPAASAAVGPGDDCAVVRLDGAADEWQLTTDPVLEGVHFPPDTGPELIGRKAVGRVLSDLAAMGGEPQWLLINVTAPPDFALDRLERIYDGARDLCAAHGAAIVGGDLGQGAGLALHVFGIGRAPRGTSVLRSGACAGDVLYVTGRLGGSRLGKHLTFEPRVAEGRWLREGQWATAMMDVSDGLSTDLRRLLQRSGVGVELEAAAVPVDPAVDQLQDGRSPLEHAWSDGEDFELLFTVAASRRVAFEAAWRAQFELACTAIGRITDQSGECTLVEPSGARRRWTAHGYEHFRSADR